MKALLLSILLPCAACAQTGEAPHDTLLKIKAIGLNEKTRDRLEPMLESAVAGWEERDPRNPEYAQTLTMLGMIRQSRADLDIDQLRTGVEPLYRKALAIYARSFAAPDDAEVALTLELHAWVLGVIGQVQDATPLRVRAEIIRKARVRELQTGGRQYGAAYKVGEGIIAPVPTKKSDPEYDEIARFLHQQGTVVLQTIVDTNGVPQDITLVRGMGFGLDEQAVIALRSWRFRPGEDGSGQPVPVVVKLEMSFRLL